MVTKGARPREESINYREGTCYGISLLTKLQRKQFVHSTSC